jgi:hypothetical protein
MLPRGLFDNTVGSPRLSRDVYIVIFYFRVVYGYFHGKASGMKDRRSVKAFSA